MRETFEQEYVRCGKPACKSCPHGPYWYAYWREDGKVKKRYIGKLMPKETKPDNQDCQESKRTKELVRIGEILFVNRGDSLMKTRAARAVLGVSAGTGFMEARRRFRALAQVHHPDRGGNDLVARIIFAAWDWLKSRCG